MAYIIDRLILLAMSVIVLTMECSTVHLIIIGLIAVSISGICYFFDRKLLTGIVGGVFIVSCIFCPVLFCVAPVVVYEMYEDRQYAEMILLGFVFVLSLGTFSAVSVAWILVLCVVACVLYTRTESNERLDHMVKNIRDDSEEKNILLAEKNRHLIEKQDSEVYVATLKERNRIAREIHDNVGHLLTRTILQMGALMTIHKEEPLHEQLSLVKDNLDVAMNNIRESVHDLHDESVDLKQAITELADSLHPRFSYNFEYDIAGKVERNYKYAMIGIVKEAVSNILKHSQNDMVDIALREHPGMYQILIHDFDKNAKATVTKERTVEELAASGGIGMQNMQDRVTALSGNMTVSMEQGFRIFVSLPKGRTL